MKLSSIPRAAGRKAGGMNFGGVRRAISLLLFAALAAPATRAETLVTSGVAPGQVVQKTDPFRVITLASNPGTVPTVEIQATGTAIFRSGNSISLQPGFKATAGSFFHAAISSSTAVPLSWPAYAGATGYNIYRNGVLLQGGVSGTAWLDTAASPNTAYTYVIKAITGGGEVVVQTVAATAASGFELFTPLLQ